MKTSSLLVALVVRVAATIPFSLAVIAAPFAHAQISFYGTPTYPGTAAVIGDFNRDGNLDIINSAGTVLLGKGNGTFITGTTLSNVPSFVADFNGDGIPDVLAFSQSGYLYVYLGNGDGTFQTPVQTYTGIQIYGPAVADLVTGNNHADVVIPNPTGGVLVFLGNGNGTFAAPVSYSSPATPQVFVADFNGDGKPDILTTTPGSSSSVSVLLGNGDGTFQSPITTTYPGFWSVQAVGDVNDDQKLDLVVYSNINASQIAVLLGNGNGTFQALSNQFTPTVSNGYPFTLADLTGNGKLDLLTQSFPFLQVYLGNGDGTFTVGSAYSYNFLNLESSLNILVGDFNNDGKPDITASQSILFGNRDGTFQAAPAILLPNGDVVSATAIADFNGDGRSDVAVTSTDGNLYIYLADAQGVLSLAHTYDISAYLVSSGVLQVGDFNGDGKLDLITTVNQSGTVLLAALLGNGDGSFGSPVESDACPPAALYGGAVGDLNGDNKSDLALPNGESLSICLGNGDGTFASPVNYFFGTGAGSVVVADFTNNGKLDAVVGGQAGAAFFLGNGDGTFQGANYILTAQSSAGPAADFNGDGNEDLIINYSVYLGNGKGGFQQAGGVTGLVDAVADLNGDGYLDVVNFYAPRALYYEVLASLGNGNGTFQSPITIESADVVGVPQAGDFNGDGRPDIAIAWATVADYDEGTLQGIQILLNTTPSAPGVTVSPSALTFPSQPVGTSSSPLSVTVNNTGKGVLTVSSVKLTGASAGEFSQTNNCTSIQPGANCIIKVVFTPSAGGNAAASLAITDNAVGSPQAVALSGTATLTPNFSIGPASGSSNSATIAAGQTASFDLAVTPAGSFSGTVSLTCAVTPSVMPAPVCAVPASVNVTQGTAAPITAKISTTAAGTAGSISQANLPSGMMPITATIVLFASGLLFAGCRRRIPAVAILMVGMLFLGMTACGGSSSPGTSTPGTPAGTYTAIVTAKSGSLSQNTALGVIVQ
jgi:hypothetical protein